jgi:hypothetical protein
MVQRDSEHSSSRITRRRFLRHASAATIATSGLMRPPIGLAAAGPRHRARPTVAVLGGGVGGLTAAHELAERGFDVTVYERRAFGGKARSMSVPGTGRGGRRPLPAEHGWREVFAGYQNLPDTMSRIPCGANPHGVLDNLVTTPTLMAARDNGDAPFFLSQPTAAPPTYTPVEALDTLAASLQWLPPDQIAYVLERFVVFL